MFDDDQSGKSFTPQRKPGRILNDPARLVPLAGLTALFGQNQRHLDQVLTNEPYLHLVGPDD